MAIGVSVEQQSTPNIIPFSDALEKTGFGIFNYLLILIVGLVFISVMLETESMGYILPISECDLKLTNAEKGILSTIGYIGIIVSSHLWGFLADTKGRRAVIKPTLIISFAVTVVSSFSNRYWILVLLRFANGFFVSGASATIYAYLGEFHSDRTRFRAIMGSALIYSIGAMIVPVVAWGVINRSWSLPLPFLGIVYKPWRLFIAVCGIPGILCGLCVFMFPESPKFLLSIGKEKEALQILKKMYKWNGGLGELNIDGLIPDNDTAIRNLLGSSSNGKGFATEFLRTMWDQTVPLFQGDFLRPTVVVCTIQFWVYVTYHGMYTWFVYFTDTMVEFMNNNPGNKSRICEVVYAKHAAVYYGNGTMQCTERLEDSTFLYTLVLEMLCGFAYVVTGIIDDKVRKVFILFFIFVAFGACGVIAVHIEYPPIALSMYLLLFISGVGSDVMGGIAIELYPTHLKAMAICISLMFARLGGVVGVNIVGLLLISNCEMIFYISGISLIGCGFLAFRIPQKMQIKYDDDIEINTFGDNCSIVNN